VTPRVVPTAARDPEIVSKVTHEFILEKTSDREGKSEQKFDDAFRTMFRIIKCFKEASRSLQF
jgi:hypothetical protein